MPKPRVLGYIANGVVSESADRLAQNQTAWADLLTLNFKGDKDGVAALVKILAKNDAVVWQAMVLLKTGQLHEAQELVLGSGKV